MIVRQQDIQRRGGVCVRYPVSCLVRTMVQDVFGEYDFLRILDLTFGEGRFWRAFDRSRIYLVGFDIRKLNWHVRPDEFYLQPSWRWSLFLKKYSFDLVVVDPPWAEWHRGWDRRGHYLACNALGWWRQIVFDAAAAAEYFDAYLLIHWKKRYIPRGFQVLNELYFKGRSRLANMDRGKYSQYSSWFAILKGGGFYGV